MSNALAIATVTQALALLIESNLRPEIDFAVSVETRKPPAEPPTDPTITVFLYQVAPNPSLRNTELPSRASGGGLLARPTAALDLHYLISAYGEETELVGQRLIGCVVRTLQEIPVLPRELLVEAASRPYLAGSDLADSAQRVRFSPIQMDTDETSKLWGMLHQTPYALSTTYQGSLVLIEGREKPVPPKPVERVVPTARPFAPAGPPGAAAESTGDEESAGPPAGTGPEPGQDSEPEQASASGPDSEPEQAPEPGQASEPDGEPESGAAKPKRRASTSKRTGTAQRADGTTATKRAGGTTATGRASGGAKRGGPSAARGTRTSPPAEPTTTKPSTSDDSRDGRG
ncbi:Pvc16 family protein [Saccharopolyspora sp. NPDC047091]|uniref:Pvc16 family protein n=1 Tax=Saccharopolyspora sp. NPDC047091 TaxID=3155924 RepID=UPI0033EE6A36